ncbi:MAG: tRNA glutamyl-Q(34) synthetase GluQRS [Silicimonas sp.]|nr:tRNA glutamyl-Q(34) synthetase GluQRS [Silicimonas sp.]
MRTRFAPSPTGPLHLGHAYSALLAHGMAQAAGGAFLLRIEDIDQSRARPEWEALIEQDLRWLGIDWEGPVMRQSERGAAYGAALDRLWAMGLLYPCICNRRDIRAAAAAPQEGASAFGPDGLIYPGTCRPDAPLQGARPDSVTLRLDMRRARALVGEKELTFRELGAGPGGETGAQHLSKTGMVASVGDVVLARRDMAAAYHLAVVVDDADQRVSHVVRGQDLFEATRIHVVLQKLLGLPTPAYHHHRLIRDDAGKRLAKRDDARAIRLYRDAGDTPAEIRARIGL